MMTEIRLVSLDQEDVAALQCANARTVFEKRHVGRCRYDRKIRIAVSTAPSSRAKNSRNCAGHSGVAEQPSAN